MKKLTYISLLLLVFLSSAFAVHVPTVPDTNYVPTSVLNCDAWQYKSLTAGWNASRNTATATTTNLGLQGDSLAACYVAGSSTAGVPSWEFGRTCFFSDTLSAGDFYTSYFAGAKPRIDSVNFKVRAYGKVDSALCTGKVYAVLVGSNPSAAVGTSNFNDWRAVGYSGDSTAFDSVALNTTAGWWTFRSGAYSNRFRALFELGANAKWFVQLVICNDYTNDSVAYNALPTTRTFYEAVQFTFADTVGTSFDPRFEVFWTDTTATATSTSSGNGLSSFLSGWKNVLKSSWRGGWRR